jgi:hypothetical protein
MDKKALQELYLAYLRDEGYKGEVDEDGDIEFKYEGRWYYLHVFEDDEYYFRVTLPSFWEIETDDEQARALEAANAMNNEYKCGKVLYVESGDGYTGMFATAESFLSAPNDFMPLFPRMLALLQNMAHAFKDAMEEGNQD